MGFAEAATTIRFRAGIDDRLFGIDQMMVNRFAQARPPGDSHVCAGADIVCIVPRRSGIDAYYDVVSIDFLTVASEAHVAARTDDSDPGAIVYAALKCTQPIIVPPPVFHHATGVGRWGARLGDASLEEDRRRREQAQPRDAASTSWAHSPTGTATGNLRWILIRLIRASTAHMNSA